MSDSQFKTSPDPDSPLKLRSEEFLSGENHRNERQFDENYRHKRISRDLGKVKEALTLHLPSPRPALDLDTFQSKLEPDIVEGEQLTFCSASLYRPDVIPQSKLSQTKDQRTFLYSCPQLSEVKTANLMVEENNKGGGLAANKIEKIRIETKNNEV